MIVVLMGPPGSGKGTQGQQLAQRFRWPYFSMGDALREQIQGQTSLGKEASAWVDRGLLVPDVLLEQILDEALLGKDFMILDGYPRNLSQAIQLWKKFSSLKIWHLEVSRDEILRRLANRWICSVCAFPYQEQDFLDGQAKVCSICSGNLVQRLDDHSEKVLVRWDVYEKEMTSVYEFFHVKGVYRKINGSDSKEKVHEALVAEIVLALEELQLSPTKADS